MMPLSWVVMAGLATVKVRVAPFNATVPPKIKLLLIVASMRLPPKVTSRFITMGVGADRDRRRAGHKAEKGDRHRRSEGGIAIVSVPPTAPSAVLLARIKVPSVIFQPAVLKLAEESASAPLPVLFDLHGRRHGDTGGWIDIEIRSAFGKNVRGHIDDRIRVGERDGARAGNGADRPHVIARRRDGGGSGQGEDTRCIGGHHDARIGRVHAVCC